MYAQWICRWTVGRRGGEQTVHCSNFYSSYESSKENSPRNSKKSPDSLAADENSVQRARGELRVLEQERSKLEKQRKTQLKDFETAKADTRRLLEVGRAVCLLH